MSLSLFFLITAIVSALFGLSTLLMPANTAKGYGFTPTPQLLWLFRIFGGMILSAGLLNFLVRNTTDITGIRAVLIFNIVFYLIRIGNDIYGMGQRLFTINKIFIGEAVHLFICIGSAIFLFS